MKPTVFVAAVFMLVLAAALAGQEKPKIVMQPAPYTDPSDPQAMFNQYCAACHGRGGKGDGPAAAALKTAPADLTRIAARNGGKFPAVNVGRYIEGIDEIPAHGSRDMPVWGQVLRVLPGGEATVKMRVEALTKYLQSIQQK
jgi:mono/diheme cytochrome c family protein